MKTLIQRLGTLFAYAYVLRVPLALWVVAVGLPLAAVPRGAPVGPLLRGLFDLSDLDEHSQWGERLIEGVSFMLVTFAALMVATAIAITARLILKDGKERFNFEQKIDVSPGIELAIRLLAALVPISIVWGSATQSWRDVDLLVIVAGTGLALLAFFRGLTPASRGMWDSRVSRNQGALEAIEGTVVWAGLGLFTRIVKETPAGFFSGSGQLLSRHAFAWLQMQFSFALYVLLFLLKIEMVAPYIPIRIPTLCLVLVLIMVACWVLAGLSFLLDRFRVPVIAVLVAYGTAVSGFPQNDHFFLTVPPTGTGREIPPAEILKTREGQPAIVVTAMGGGIHAGAWVARVLAGLQRDSQQCSTDFDQAFRVVSSVSGGSMGAMFIVDAYENKRLTVPNAEKAVKAAEASSLDDIAWALAYPDLVWRVFPLLKEVDLTLDRGTVLENSWKRTESLGTVTFDQWRRDALDGRRPAVIFNATIVETGERMLLATTSIDKDNVRDTRARRIDFGTDPDSRRWDVQVATAARLSSTFPYVSPPARMKGNTVFDNQFHLVDGGYYDNYGTASLAEWLEQALTQTSGRPSQVLILQIRTFPAGERPVPDGKRGWLFETGHPLVTLFNVRGSAQASTADITDRLLRLATPGYIVSETVDFPVLAAQDLDDLSPPLSWHLTPADRARLETAWDKPDAPLRRVRSKVQNFLKKNYGSDIPPACLQ